MRFVEQKRKKNFPTISKNVNQTFQETELIRFLKIFHKMHKKNTDAREEKHHPYS